MVDQFCIASDAPIPAGNATRDADFAYDGGGMGEGATVRPPADEKQIGVLRVDNPAPALCGTGGLATVGDYGSPVSPGYGAPLVITGALERVRIDLVWRVARAAVFRR